MRFAKLPIILCYFKVSDVSIRYLIKWIKSFKTQECLAAHRNKY